MKKAIISCTFPTISIPNKSELVVILLVILSGLGPVKGSKKIVNKFNLLFDLFWNNSDGMAYTVDYQGKYKAHAGMNRWRDGENWGYVSW